MIRSGLKTQKPNDVKYCFVTSILRQGVNKLRRILNCRSVTKKTLSRNICATLVLSEHGMKFLNYQKFFYTFIHSFIKKKGVKSQHFLRILVKHPYNMLDTFSSSRKESTATTIKTYLQGQNRT